MSAGRPLIANIRRFSLDDGPGIRTTVFFKGCPLACIWCHNPECQSEGPEIGFHSELCIHCESCARACGAGAICPDAAQRVNREACTACGDCAEACPPAALRMIGTYYPPGQLVELILRDRPFFDVSGGGATFSVGEPAMHIEYLSGVLEELKRVGIHTAVQTCGLYDAAAFTQQVLPYADLIYFDVKLLDPADHWKYTGRPNAAILRNFRQLAATARSKLVPRMPLIPGITTTDRNLRAAARFLRETGYSACQLLSYNPGVIAKRRTAGMPGLEELPEALPGVEEQRRWRETFLEYLAA